MCASHCSRSVRWLASLSAPAQLAATSLHLHKQQKVLEVSFNDGSTHAFSAELLRVTTPSAENHAILAQGEAKVVAGRRHVGIMQLEPVGAYAVRIHFDDLHHTGIFTWEQLHRLGQHKFAAKRAYLRELRDRGLSRDPSRRGSKQDRGGQQQQQQQQQQK